MSGRASLCESTVARVRKSGGHFQSNLYSFRRVEGWILSVIAGVRNNGVSTRRELTVFWEIPRENL